MPPATTEGGKMGIVNDTMCSLLEERVYFVDFWQGAVLQGRYRLDGEVTCRDAKEYYARKLKKSGGRRDVLMKYNGKNPSIMAIEVMDTVDYTIPARIMDYDSRENKRQLNELAIINRQGVELEQISWEHGGEFMYGVRKQDRILPVKTVGLCCSNMEYDGATDVWDMYKFEGMSQDCRDMYNHYPVQIIDMHKLDEKVFETGLRELVGVFKRSRDREALKAYYLENEERFRRLDDYVIDAMGALIGMSKLKEFKHENGGVDMCKAFEDEREEGRREGRMEGRMEGRLEGIEQTLANNLRNIIKKLGYSVEQALQLLMVPEEEWSKYKELV